MATPDLPPKTLNIGEYRFTISEATDASDISDFVDIFDAAFADNLLFCTMNGTADRAALKEENLGYWTAEWTASGRRHFKVVDGGTGKIAAISRWWFPHVPTPEEEAKAEEAKNGPKPEPVPGANVAVQKAFLALLLEKRTKWVTKDDMYLMNILAVDPAYQRLGLGAALLEPVLKIADKESRKTFIEASAAGEKLYRKFGWVDIGETISLDFTEYGGKVDILVMMREPGAGISP